MYENMFEEMYDEAEFVSRTEHSTTFNWRSLEITIWFDSEKKVTRTTGRNKKKEQKEQDIKEKQKKIDRLIGNKVRRIIK